MKMPAVPDLARPGHLALAALATGAVVATTLWLMATPHLGPSLGDTDDATRIVLVRELLAGRGWYDQLVTRLQPPQGVYLHWSRLLDGGIAGWEAGWRLLLPPARAEWMTRATWPLLWAVAAVAAALAGASGLAGRGPKVAGRGPIAGGAVLAAAVICMLDLSLYWAQFLPGRVDHHDVQIVLALVAAAGAMSGGPAAEGRGRTGAIVCGLATGLGLAIGLEALVFEAAIAASFGLRLWADRRAGPRATAYGLSLAAATALAFVAQTPPWRWGVPACDALGLNLLAGAVTGGLALAMAGRMGARHGWPVRLAWLAAGGTLALATYLALDPHCLRGPFADVDPRLKPFWLDHVQEMRRWPLLYKQERGNAISVAIFTGMGALAWALTGLFPGRRGSAAWLLSGVLLLMGAAAAWEAFRMDAYAEWFSVAPLAVLASELANLLPRRSRLLGVVALGAVFSPVGATGAVLMAMKLAPWQTARKGVGGPPDYCYSPGAYAVLAQQPPGLTVSEIDLGPFVLAYTSSPSLSAPYHRMSRGVMAAREVMVAPADGAAQARARAAGAAYVLECPVHARHADRDHLAADTLQKRLDRGDPPAWLQRLSPAGAPLVVYQVRPTGAASPPPAAPAPATLTPAAQGGSGAG